MVRLSDGRTDTKVDRGNGNFTTTCGTTMIAIDDLTYLGAKPRAGRAQLTDPSRPRGCTAQSPNTNSVV